jgi:hypothetical protein
MEVIPSPWRPAGAEVSLKSADCLISRAMASMAAWSEEWLEDDILKLFPKRI